MDEDDIKVLKGYLKLKLVKLAWVCNKNIIHNVSSLTDDKAILDDGTWCDLDNCTLSEFIVYEYIDE